MGGAVGGSIRVPGQTEDDPRPNCTHFRDPFLPGAWLAHVRSRPTALFRFQPLPLEFVSPRESVMGT